MRMKHERIRWRKTSRGRERERGFISLPTAILASAGIGAGGSLLSSFLQSNASANSIATQQAMFQQGAQIQQSEYSQGLAQLLKMYGIGQDAQGNYVAQGQNALNTFAGQGTAAQAGYFGGTTGALPTFIGAGASAAPTLTSLLTPGNDLSAQLAQMPGYKFALQQGGLGITNQETMRGLSGNTLAAGGQYASGLAASTYGGIVQQLQALLGTGAQAAGQYGVLGTSAGNAALSALFGAGNTSLTALTGAGNTALTGAAGVGGSALTGSTAAGNALLAGATGAGQGLGQTMVGQGQAQAAGGMGAANALAGGTNAFANVALLDALSRAQGGKGLNFNPQPINSPSSTAVY